MSSFFDLFSNRRALLALCALSLVTAACGGDSSADQPAAAEATTTTTTTAQTTTAPPQTTTTSPPQTTTTSPPQTTTTSPPQTTTTTAAEPTRDYQPAVFSYRYPSSGEVAYRISIQQEAEVTLDGGPPEEMPPGPIQISSTLEGTITYRTSPGPEEGTTRIQILSDLEIVENKMSIGGIALPDPGGGAAPGFETPIDITVVVDEKGNVLEVISEGLDELFGDLSLLFPSSVGTQDLNRPFGPAFPDHPVDVGDTWTERVEQEGTAGMGTIVTNAEHRLVGVDTKAGRTILVVESEYRTEALEWDMSEFLQGMFGAFADELSEEEAPESEQAIPEFTLLMSASPITVIAVTRFDSEAGLVLEGEYQVSAEVTTDMTLPDETGEPASIISSTSYDQTVTYIRINPAA